MSVRRSPQARWHDNGRTTVGSRLERGGRAGRRQLGVLSILTVAALALGGFANSAVAQENDDLAMMSLEELMNVEVTSVSKKAEKRTDAAAAIFVLTNDDIRRSGATSIAEVLRLVPGVNVARLSQNKWSITSRGFSGRFANKLLVLIDGRSVYTPLFSGVYWENQDVVLEDVDRIEVIRGPGGTLWGANAVNGVINIVTKRSEDTQGVLLKGGAGTEERGFGTVRYGGAFSEDDFYRIYAKYTNRDEGETLSGGDGGDESWIGQGGFRTDWTLNERDSFTLQGDYFSQESDERTSIYRPVPPFVTLESGTEDFDGFNVLGRWTREFDSGNQLQVQLYHDYYESDSLQYNITDLEYQHRYRVNDRYEVIWGAGIRNVVDQLDGTVNVRYGDEDETTNIFSAFINNQVEVADTITLHFGTKIEHNSYTDFEIQPSARFSYKPTERHTFWGAISRTVRTPNRAEDDIFIVSGAFPPGFQGSPVPVVAVLAGDKTQKSEELIAFELGYRVRPTERWAIDFAAYYNQYDNLLSANLPVITGPIPELGFTTPHAVSLFRANNSAEATTAGFELTVDWMATSWWRLRGAYSLFQIETKLDPASFNANAGANEGNFPEQSAYIQSNVTLNENVDVDLTVRYVDRLSALSVDDYLTLDARIAWRPKEGLELAIVGQNLLEDDHPEFAADFIATQPTEVERGVYGQVVWEF